MSATGLSHSHDRISRGQKDTISKQVIFSVENCNQKQGTCNHLSTTEIRAENSMNLVRAEQLGPALRMRIIPRAINDLLKSAHSENWYCWKPSVPAISACVPALDFGQIPWLQFAWLQVWLQNAPTLQPLPIKQNRFHLNKAQLRWLAKSPSLSNWRYPAPAIVYTTADSR